MKLLFSILAIALSGNILLAQEFDKNLATARNAYSSGNLQDSRFAMEQMLRDLDIQIGKEILKLLPVKMGTQAANDKEDNVNGSTGLGLFVHRTYGANGRVNLEIINNSPIMAGINAILSTPILGGMMRDENQKVIKVQGYKSLLNKNVDSTTGKTNYELQIPLNNTLVTLKANDTSEADITGWANTIPLAKILQLAQ